MAHAFHNATSRSKSKRQTAGWEFEFADLHISANAGTGNYDCKLEWTSGPGETVGASDTAQRSDTSAPSLFTAIQEQLGLKLEPTKAPVEVLVIDRVEKPISNRNANEFLLRNNAAAPGGIKA